MQYEIHALDERRQVVALALEAPSEEAARKEAAGRGLSVFAVKHLEARKVLRLLLKRPAAFPTTLFSIELMALLEAGLNLVEALSTLAEKNEGGGSNAVLSGLVGAIRRGEPFSQAVARFPRHFSPLYVATIKASERTGNVKEALSRYIAYQEELDRVREKVVSASIYPAILMIVGALVLGFLMLYVVPRFAQVYEDMAHSLPFFSRLLLAFGSFVGKHSLALVCGLLALGGLSAWMVRRPAVSTALCERLWRLPALGSRMKVYQLARLYRTAGMLMRAGIP